jgi:hypothetical protein
MPNHADRAPVRRAGAHGRAHDDADVPAAGADQGIVTLDAVAAAGTTRVDYFLGGRPIAYDATCCLWEDTWDGTTAADGAMA